MQVKSGSNVKSRVKSTLERSIASSAGSRSGGRQKMMRQNHSMMIASAMAAAPTTTMHAAVGSLPADQLSPEQEQEQEQDMDGDEEQSSHDDDDQSLGGRQTLPQHLDVDGTKAKERHAKNNIMNDEKSNASNDNDDDNDYIGDVDGSGVGEEKKDAQNNFNGPTPLHKNNSGFFQEEKGGNGVTSQSNVNALEVQVEVEEPSDADGSHQVERELQKELIPIVESQSLSLEESESGPPPSNQSSSSLKREQQSSPKTSPRKSRRSASVAVIEGDASTAFSNHRPVTPLSSLCDNTANNNSNHERRSKNRRDKRDHSRDGKNRGSRGSKNGNKKKRRSKENVTIEGIDAGRRSYAAAVSDAEGVHHHPTASSSSDGINSTSSNPIHSILATDGNDDPILRNYLPQLAFLDDNYYSKVRPFELGKRNLPPNQLEVILRRRAIIKRTDVVQTKVVVATATTVGGADKDKGKVGAVGEGGKPKPSESPPPPRRPPMHQNSPSRRRTLFPQQQQSPNSSRRKSAHDNDDDDASTISSTTVVSQANSLQSLQSTQQQLQQHQPSLIQTSNTAAVAVAEIPTEETVGDTSLGLKLTILQGKVIIQHITPLDDGRASPAQLCGLLSVGDIIIAVNGKSMINGTIHDPVSMDRIISVLRPLSQPMDEETKEYSREVRLRFALKEGLPLLRARQEREKLKMEEMERRKQLGFDTKKGGMTTDPAADLFGFGAFMAVDQHSGMPMFGHMDHHNKEKEEEDEKKEEKMKHAASAPALVGDDAFSASNKMISAKLLAAEKEAMRMGSGMSGKKKDVPTSPRARPPTVQAQIAHQIQLDRKYVRDRNTSGFFSMNDKAPTLLRPQSPPPEDLQETLMKENPADVRKRRLEQGARTMKDAKSLVTIVEQEDKGITIHEDEDPMEVASRVCGTASIRTGASRRRWHRGDNASVNNGPIAEETSIAAASAASSMEVNTNFDVSTIRSGDSGGILGEGGEFDNRLLVELAANNNSWKVNVIKRLDGYAEETENEGKSSLHRGSSGEVDAPSVATGFDSFLFGGDVANILGKKKQSLALPPGEMTSMLYDLVDLLEGGLPDQIFMGQDDPNTTQLSAMAPFTPEKAVTFAKESSDLERNEDVTKATHFLLDEALGTWLKSFRPLPWKQRRALWPSHSQSSGDGDMSTIVSSSRFDDNESLSLMSGSIATGTQQRTYEKDKRNLRELIEDMELDHETRRETCRLATFYFTQRFSEGPLSQENEEQAADMIDAYGSYLDIYKCLICAGKLRSKLLVDKLVGVAKYDYQHKEAVKALQRAKVLVFYEPNMLSALLGLLPSISSEQISSNLDFTALLVSAYPDLQPWCVQAASDSEGAGDFYMEYLSSLLHHEDGNDAAKRDDALVKEWCLMLCSPDEADPATVEMYRKSFFHIASRDDSSSLFYYRDLSFLMDVSVKMSEFGLTLSLANEIVSNARYCRNKSALSDVLQHLCIITDKAIEGNEGEINTVLLGQVISFFNIISSRMDCGFDNVTELSNLLEKCHIENQNNPHYPPANIDACITTISENAPPTDSLKVLSQWEHSSVSSPSLIMALHTSLIRGAREGVRSELSGSLLRIQRAREEGRRPTTISEHYSMSMSWNVADVEEEPTGGGEEEEGFIWSSVLDGTLEIAK